MPTLYDTLGVPPSATDEDIKKAYKERAKDTHPDKPSGDKEQFQAVALAYSILSDQDKRAHYDQTGQTSQAPFETKFMGFVNGLMGQLINSTIPAGELNVVSYIQSTIQISLTHLHQNIISNQRQLNKVQSMRKRIKMKGQGDNLLDRVLQQNEDIFKNAIGSAESEIEFLMKCHDKIEGYEYEGDIK